MARITRVLAAITVAATTISLSPTPTHAAPTGVYIVQNGDYLAGIASKLGVKLDALLAANGINQKSLIVPGQQLVVPAGAAPAAPAPASAPAPAASGLTYTVQNGDFLAGIASKSGVKLADLLAVNKMTAKSLITPGKVLQLPAGATAPAAPAATPAAPAVSTLTHTVQNGDYLAGIASTYKVKLAELLAVNKMSVTSLIRPGMKLALPASAVAPAAKPKAAAAPTGTGIDAVLSYALAQQGKPYRFFTAGPEAFDCSGLTMAAYARIGVSLVHHSASQATQGTAVDFYSESIRPGDLVFLAPHGGEISHVGLALSATTWIHAPKPGDVVRVGPMPAKGAIIAVRRFVPAG